MDYFHFMTNKNRQEIVVILARFVNKSRLIKKILDFYQLMRKKLSLSKMMIFLDQDNMKYLMLKVYLNLRKEKLYKILVFLKKDFQNR